MTSNSGQQQHGGYRPLQQVPHEYPRSQYPPAPVNQYSPAPANQYPPAPANMGAQQQSSNTNVVVTNQPAVATMTVTPPSEKPDPRAFIVTIILMSFSTFCCCMLPLLLCFVPALILSVVGFNYGYSKSRELQKQSRLFLSVAIGLDIAAGVVFCVAMLITAIIYAVTLSS